jgi:DNA-binding NtrC family response regulator
LKCWQGQTKVKALNPRILIVDDEASIRSSLTAALTMEAFSVAGAADLAEARRQLEQARPDAVLLDLRLPDGDGLSLFDDRGLSVPVVVMSGHGTMDDAVRALRRGACDFLEKPVGSDRLVVTLNNALELARLSQENQRLQEEVEQARGSMEIVGTSPAMVELADKIARIAPSEGRVLITGENGSGKELVAHALHAGSRRREGPFVSLNCGAVPAELIEAELFGHEKGAYTGAETRRAGRFERADGGTLFLDEVGDMPPAMQVKLLRVLQTDEVERVGGATPFRIDVRIIAATNKDLDAEVEAGRFREDLYYRLNVVPLEVPPLRERRADIPVLAEHLLKDSLRRNRRRLRFTVEALEMLQQHHYPGNVRELRNLVERMVILAPPDRDELNAADVAAVMPSTGRSARSAGWRPGAKLSELVTEAERSIVREALAAHEGSIPATARSLGVERSNFHKKLKALGLK